MADSLLSGKSRDSGWGVGYEKTSTVYMRPVIVPEGLLTKGYSWEVNDAEFVLGLHAIFPCERLIKVIFTVQ